MHCSSLLLAAVSAAAVIAAPVEKRAYTTEVVVVVQTIYTTVYPTSSAAATAISPLAALQNGGWGGPHTTQATSASSSSTSTQTSVIATPKPEPSTSSSTEVETTTTQQPTTAASTPTTTATHTTSPSSTSSPVAGACEAWQPQTDLTTPPVSCGIDLLTSVNKYRTAYGKKTFSWSAAMAKAAVNTVTLNQGGVTMVHHLTQGSNAEVITPGFWETGDLKTQGDTPFEVALVDWFCEVGSDPQLQASGFTGINQCNIAHNVASISGSANPNEPTGHHDILLGDYSEVGCAYMPNAQFDGKWPQFAGQWTCDFKI